MEETVIIKNKKGRKIPLTAKQVGSDIILTKKNDKSNEGEKRKIVLYILDKDRYEKFKSIKVEKPHVSMYQKISKMLQNAIKKELE